MRLRVRDLLVVELLGGIGDLLLVLPAVHALGRAHPRASVRVVTFEGAAPLLAHDPSVHEVVAVPKHAGKARDAVERELCRRRPDLAVSTTMYEGIPDLLAAGSGRAVTNLWRTPPPDQLVDERFLCLLARDGLIHPKDVAEPLRLVLTGDERAEGRARLRSLLPRRARPPVLALLDAGMEVKRWPVDRWRDLVTGLVAERVPVLVPTAGDPSSTLLAADAGAVVVPSLPLRALAALFAAVAEAGGTAVGPDTGPLRLAQSVGLPVVGLFGPTLGARYGPRREGGTVLQGLPGCAVRRPLAISEQECWWTARCPVSGSAPACMADIPVAGVRAGLLAVEPC